MNNEEKLEACDRNTKHRPSSITYRKLDIVFLLVVKKHPQMQQFRRWKNITGEYYLEPNKLCPKEDIENDLFEDMFVPDTKKESTQNKTGEGLILLKLTA